MVGLCRVWTLIWFLLDWDLHACNTIQSRGEYAGIELLRPRLSKEAQIFLPGSGGYVNATLRWSSLFEPGLAVVVAPKTERDIQETIKYANEVGSPFLAIGGRHGTTKALNNAKDAVGIWTRGMRTITVHEPFNKDGKGTATVEPGVQAGELTSTLFAKGKTAASTACDCVGVMGAMLGGGHGFLQGRYGLTTDNMVSARLVTAKGSVVTASRTENPDLFWALRGAGHNFGIVASVEYRVFERRPETDAWAYEEYVFSHDKLERVYELANGMIGGPVELTHYGHFERRPPVDAEHPVLPFWVIWQGPDVPSKYTAPLRTLGPLSTKRGVVDITQLNGIAGANLSSPFCAYGAEVVLSPTGLRKYNRTALRRALDIFASFPPHLQRSAVLLEGYAVEAMQRVPEAATAYPERFNNLLVSPVMIATGPDDGTGVLRAEMKGYADRFRAAMVEGSRDRLYAYVNYASGDEGLEAVYGYDQWRLEKLRRLKKAWDPKGRMDFYNPIS
ncbi:FAD-binding domain-containing protein [Apiospora saccharicola]|uniref:FAD-binding domain-containing protein n=1 Tax=Apiospora saccharicola TaxID=335842 RepID=A0ABR1UE27_9PEZI